MVSADENDIITGDAVIAELDGLYLMQFEDEETTALAYMYYSDKANSADVDTPVMIADDDAVAIEDAGVTPIEMDETSNPFVEAQSTIEEIQDSETDTTTDLPVIALIDTGISSGLEAVHYSVMGDDGTDNHGHGTRMAEIISGICPDAQIISIKATDDSGVGSTSSLYAAIQLAIELNVDIINLSVYGLRSSENSMLGTAIQTAVTSGITVVGAAGNSGRDASGYIPGYISSAVIVGSVNEGGTLASFSNFGETVDYYVVSGSTSEAAATVSALMAADALSVDDERIFTEYIPVSSNADDSLAPWSARTFIYAFLADPFTIAEGFGENYIPTTDELSGLVYRAADEESYESILLAVDVWNQELTAETREAVNAVLSSVEEGLTYECLAHAAYDYVMENHDGQLRLDFFTLDYENETIVPVEAYCELGELVLVTEPEFNDEIKIAAYSSTETFITTVSAKYENQYSSTYSYYASNGSKIMNMKTTQYLDFYTNTLTRDTYGDIKSHWLRSGGVDYRAYCARPSGTFPAGYYPSNTSGNTFWSKMSWNMVYGMVKAIGYSDYIIDQYTYKGGVAAATQVIVWSLAGNHMDKWGQAGTYYADGYFWNNAYNLPDSNYWGAFYRIRDLMWIHGGKPSFSYNSTTEANANPVTPTYNSSTGKYTYTWTDTADSGTEKTYSDSSQTFLERYFTFDALDDSGNVISGITFTVSGNTVTMTATPEAMATSDVITIRVNTPTRDFSDEYFGIYYSSSAGGQPVVSMFGGPGKPVYAWMAIKGVTQPTSFTIQKRGSSKAGPLLGGATFQLWAYDSGWSVVDTITSSTGYYTVSNLTPGKWYAIRETVAPSGYNLDDSSFRYFKGQAVSTSYPTFYNTFSDSSENAISDGYIWIDTPTTTTTPTPAPTPTPTPSTTTVSFNIQKRANSATGTLLSGATFAVYEYTTSWQSFATVTSSTGYYSITGLTPGRWYYIRETVAPSGYTIDDTSYRYFKAPTTSGTIPTIYNTPTASSDNAITNGHIWVDTPTTTTTPTPTPTPTPSYDYDIRVRKMNEDGTTPLAGAVFEIRNASGSVLATGTTSGTYGYATWDTNNSIWFSTTNYLGQYLHIYEVEAPSGYEISLTEPILIRPGYNPANTSGTGYSISRNSTMDYLITAYDEEEQKVPVRIRKTTASGFSDWVSGNSCYDLAGTQFAVYDNPNYAANNTVAQRVSFDVVDFSGNVTASNQTVLTVGSNGYTPYIQLDPGKQYWIREIATGSGYLLPSNPVTAITVGTTSQQEFTVSNTPGSDPTTLVLYKSNKSGTNNKPLSGAIFSIEYFSGYYDSESAARAATGITHRTWYVTTKAGTGNNAGKYVAMRNLNPSMKVL